MQDDQDNGESPALDTLEIWNGSSTAESATDEPLATRSAAYDFSGDDSADSGAYQPPLDDDARDSRTFQVADHGVAFVSGSSRAHPLFSQFAGQARRFCGGANG